MVKESLLPGPKLIHGREGKAKAVPITVTMRLGTVGFPAAQSIATFLANALYQGHAALTNKCKN